MNAYAVDIAFKLINFALIVALAIAALYKYCIPAVLLAMQRGVDERSERLQELDAHKQACQSLRITIGDDERQAQMLLEKIQIWRHKANEKRENLVAASRKRAEDARAQKERQVQQSLCNRQQKTLLRQAVVQAESDLKDACARHDVADAYIDAIIKELV